jgi:hypothetical protein
MWKRAVRLGVAVAGIAACPGAAYAQAPGGNDPAAGSPAGAMYQIPLQGAREDASPAGPSGAVSTVRSEHGFSSSSAVPADPAGAPADPADNSGAPADPGDNAGAPADPADNSGAPADPGDRAAGRARPADAPTIAVSAARAPVEPSHARSYLLLALGVVVAVALGAAARRAARGP